MLRAATAAVPSSMYGIAGAAYTPGFGANRVLDRQPKPARLANARAAQRSKAHVRTKQERRNSKNGK